MTVWPMYVEWSNCHLLRLGPQTNQSWLLNMLEVQMCTLLSTTRNSELPTSRDWMCKWNWQSIRKRAMQISIPTVVLSAIWKYWTYIRNCKQVASTAVFSVYRLLGIRLSPRVTTRTTPRQPFSASDTSDVVCRRELQNMSTSSVRGHCGVPANFLHDSFHLHSSRFVWQKTMLVAAPVTPKPTGCFGSLGWMFHSSEDVWIKCNFFLSRVLLSPSNGFFDRSQGQQLPQTKNMEDGPEESCPGQGGPGYGCPTKCCPRSRWSVAVWGSMVQRKSAVRGRRVQRRSPRSKKTRALLERRTVRRMVLWKKAVRRVSLQRAMPCQNIKKTIQGRLVPRRVGGKIVCSRMVQAESRNSPRGHPPKNEPTDERWMIHHTNVDYPHPGNNTDGRLAHFSRKRQLCSIGRKLQLELQKRHSRKNSLSSWKPSSIQEWSYQPTAYSCTDAKYNPFTIWRRLEMSAENGAD